MAAGSSNSSWACWARGLQAAEDSDRPATRKLGGIENRAVRARIEDEPLARSTCGLAGVLWWLDAAARLGRTGVVLARPRIHAARLRDPLLRALDGCGAERDLEPGNRLPGRGPSGANLQRGTASVDLVLPSIEQRPIGSVNRMNRRVLDWVYVNLPSSSVRVQGFVPSQPRTWVRTNVCPSEEPACSSAGTWFPPEPHRCRFAAAARSTSDHPNITAPGSDLFTGAVGHTVAAWGRVRTSADRGAFAVILAVAGELAVGIRPHRAGRTARGMLKE